MPFPSTPLLRTFAIAVMGLTLAATAARADLVWNAQTGWRIEGGDDRHPQWYGNLTANPDVEITIRGETRKLRARTATPAEKAELWPQIVSAYKGYGGYQKKTDRDIPVVICEPRPGPPG